MIISIHAKDLSQGSTPPQDKCLQTSGIEETLYIYTYYIYMYVCMCMYVYTYIKYVYIVCVYICGEI